MLVIFLDIETTGLDCTRHVVIDVAFQVVDMSTNTILASYQSLIKHPLNTWQLADPTSLQINGYTYDLISEGKEGVAAKEEIIKIFSEFSIERGKAVFICQNPAFDRAFFMQLVDVYTQEKLRWPYHWLDFASMHWALVVKETTENKAPFPEKVNVSKNDIAKSYHLPEEQTPHRAMQGVEHLMLCYQTVFGLHFKTKAN